MLTVWVVELTAAPIIRSSVSSSPRSTSTTWPRDITMTVSQSPSSSFASEDATTTGMPVADTSRRIW